MNLVIILLIKALDIYLYLIIASVIMSWLIAFDVLNMRNKLVYKGCYWLNRLVNPPMLYLRKFIPPLGNIDFTPMIMWFLIIVVQRLLVSLLVY
jgi:YggT family protein